MTTSKLRSDARSSTRTARPSVRHEARQRPFRDEPGRLARLLNPSPIGRAGPAGASDERDKPSLATRIAVVTGASRGIGAGIVTALQASGMTVIGLSLNHEATAADRWQSCDVADAQQVCHSIAEVQREFGRIDLLVNCAGIAHYATLTETSLEIWNRTLAVNLTGSFLTMRAVLPGMLAQDNGRGHGRIINIASVAAKRGEPQAVAYSASKHALIGLTRSTALQVAKSGITVNAICPASVPTDMLAAGLDEWAEVLGRPVEVCRRLFQSANPQNRMVEIEEVAAMVAYLASDAARGINGQAINLCGGMCPA